LHNDVAPDGRKDAMFAIMYRHVHIIHEVKLLAQPTAFAKGKHH